MSVIQLPSNPRVLIVGLRRLGDVLMTTPLMRSVKRAFPGAAIEALVFAGTEGILSGVMTISPRPGVSETLSLLRRLARRYDLALSPPKSATARPRSRGSRDDKAPAPSKPMALRRT